MVLNGPSEVEMATESGEPIERWKAKRRMSLLISILECATAVSEATGKYGLTVVDVEGGGRGRFLFGAENVLPTRTKSDEVLKYE